jgi:hypothetical protein
MLLVLFVFGVHSDMAWVLTPVQGTADGLAGARALQRADTASQVM